MEMVSNASQTHQLNLSLPQLTEDSGLKKVQNA